MRSKNEPPIDLEQFRQRIAGREGLAKEYYVKIREFVLDAFELRDRRRQEKLDALEENRLRNLEKHLSNHGMLGLVPD